MTLTFVVGHVSNGCMAGKALALAFVQTSFNPALCKKANFFCIIAVLYRYQDVSYCNSRQSNRCMHALWFLEDTLLFIYLFFYRIFMFDTKWNCCEQFSRFKNPQSFSQFSLRLGTTNTRKRGCTSIQPAYRVEGHNNDGGNSITIDCEDLWAAGNLFEMFSAELQESRIVPETNYRRAHAHLIQRAPPCRCRHNRAFWAPFSFLLWLTSQDRNTYNMI